MRKKKLNLSLSEKTEQALDQLVIDAEAESKAEVIKWSLAVYDFLLQEKKAGSELIVRRPDGKELNVVLMP